MVLRRIWQAFGLACIFVALFYTYEWIVAGANGETSPFLTFVGCFINICGGVGGGLLCIFADPIKLTRGSTWSLHRIAEREEYTSFADRIHAYDDEESES